MQIETKGQCGRKCGQLFHEHHKYHIYHSLWSSDKPQIVICHNTFAKVKSSL
jgi:hypothetical protein